MKKRIRNLIAAVMALMMLAGGLTGFDTQVQAAPGDLKIVEGSSFDVKPGETSHISVTLEATDYMARPEIVISADEGAPFLFSTPKMYVNQTEVTSLITGIKTRLEFDATVSETAEIGVYPVTIQFTYFNVFGEWGSKCSITINLKVSEEKVPAQLTLGNTKLEDTNIGSKTNLTFTVKNEGEITAKNVYLLMDLGDNIEARYTTKNIKIGDMEPGSTKEMTLPVTILSTAAAGRQAITANFTYKTASGEKKTSAYTFYVNLTSITSEVQTPKLIIEDVLTGKGLKPGDKFELAMVLKNIGGAKAENVLVNVDESSIGATSFLKNFYTDGITVKDIKQNGEATVNVPLTVSKYANGELKPVKLVITYTDESGTLFTINETVYVDVVVPDEAPEPTKAPASANLIVSNVTQNPVQPVAGEKVEVSFDIENRGNADVSELKVQPTGLSEATFIPVNSDPYLYYDVLKAGEKIRVTIPLIVSKMIPEGLNNFTVNLVYADSSESVTIPVKNVINETGTISKPKLIVSQYYADVEELRAGSTFNFTFDLKNTNTSATARNITVTVKPSDDNTFSVAQGGNSFYISNIGPGETVSTTLPLKVKSDAATGTYKMYIQLEYEYDGLLPDENGEIRGEEKTIEVNLQAVENARPVVDNVNVYSWEGIVSVGSTAMVSFEFYNMGKSQLNNVTVYVEGDFTKADGSMQFLGTVAPGSSSYSEIEVIPNVEGTAYGVLRVTYEDSNGDLAEFTKEFDAQVMAAGGMYGPIDEGAGEVFNPDVPVAKKEIVPLWAFILIQIGIVVLFIPITRKVIISVYKAKMRRKEQEQYYNNGMNV